MLLYLGVLWFIFFSIFIDVQSKINVIQNDWMKSLTTYINLESSIYQVMLIIGNNEDKKDPLIEKVVRQIQEIKPSTCLTIQEFAEKKTQWQETLAIRDSRTSLFVIFDFPKNASEIAKDTISFLQFLSGLDRPRPKCLIIKFSDTEQNADSNQKRLLRYLWGKQFLDNSILEITEVRKEHGNLLAKTESTAKLLYFNPFKNAFSKTKYNSKTLLYPDRLRNMNGFQMKVAIGHMPPHLHIHRNSTGHPVSYSGSDIRLIEALSKFMNFTLDLDAGEKVLTNQKHNTVIQFRYQLCQNKKQIILYRIAFFKLCDKSRSEYLRIELGSLNALVPIKRIQTQSTNWNIFYVLFPIVIFSATLGLLMYMLKIFKEHWSFSYTILVVLGLSVPEQPQKLKSRIVFAYIVILCFFYSSDIYALFTNTKLSVMISEQEMSTLHDLNVSKLILIATPMMIERISDFDKDMAHLSVVKNYRYLFSSSEDCVHHLILEKNISCIILKSSEKWFNFYYRNKDGLPLMKALDESFLVSLEGFHLEPSSPYAQKFQNVLNRLMECGVFEKWRNDVLPHYDDFRRDSGDSDYQLEIGSKKLRFVVIILLAVGYSISCLVFIVEIVVAKAKKD